jgi:hypothetical protein
MIVILVLICFLIFVETASYVTGTENAEANNILETAFNSFIKYLETKLKRVTKII